MASPNLIRKADERNRRIIFLQEQLVAFDALQAAGRNVRAAIEVTERMLCREQFPNNNHGFDPLARAVQEVK